jgi:TolA-binding protein
MKNNFWLVICGMILGLHLTLSVGCLRTRESVRESDQKEVMQEQVSTLQLKNADSIARLTETQEVLRDVSGRVGNLENRMDQFLKFGDSRVNSILEHNQVLKRQVDLLQQEVVQLQSSWQSLQQEAKANAAAASSSHSLVGEKSKSSGKEGVFEEAESFFNKKDWKRAIVTYQKYREESPKSFKTPEVVYKIGVSFQELGLKDEARAFFDEAISKYPQSPAARKSRIRLKAIK